MDRGQLEPGFGEPLLKIGDARRIVVIEVQPRGEQLDDVKSVGRDFEQVVAAEPPLVIETRRDAVQSRHLFTRGSGPRLIVVLRCGAPAARADARNARAFRGWCARTAACAGCIGYRRGSAA